MPVAAAKGVALYATNETVTITNVTISGNSATGGEGGNVGSTNSGVYPGGAGGSGQGGGAYAVGGTLSLTTGTVVSSNVAIGGSGGRGRHRQLRRPWRYRWQRPRGRRVCQQ